LQNPFQPSPPSAWSIAREHLALVSREPQEFIDITERMPVSALRHFAYAGGWKQFEPLWDWAIRTWQVLRTRTVLERVLRGVGREAEQAAPRGDIGVPRTGATYRREVT